MHILEYNVKMDLEGIMCKMVAYSGLGVEWQAVVNTVMNPGFIEGRRA
jgi:hypothetical protein